MYATWRLLHHSEFVVQVYIVKVNRIIYCYFCNKLDFTSHNIEQPLQGNEIQEKEKSLPAD